MVSTRKHFEMGALLRFPAFFAIAGLFCLSTVLPARAADDSGKHVTTLRDVRKIYIEPMPNGFDNFLRAAISRKLHGFFTIVLNKSEADGILKSADTRSTEVVKTVTMVDPSDKVVLWSGSANDKETAYLGFRHGGEQKVADKLAGQLKKAIE